MTNLNSRLRKAKDLMEKSIPDKGRVFFFRMPPGIMGDAEQRFRENNPDFDGEILVFTLGTANLNPYVPDGDNERTKIQN